MMWRWLRARRFSGYKFRRQHPMGVYHLDFFCEKAELNLELDGSQHGFPEQRKHDEAREKFLKSRGIKTLRFWNSQLRHNSRMVRDTIFEELQKRAFTAVLSTTKAKGTGLGLAIVARIIETHRGTLRIKSKIGRGTSIIITLPVK